jgi:hypothetical protein
VILKYLMSTPQIIEAARMTGCIQWPLPDSPVLLTVLNEDLICRQASQARLACLGIPIAMDEIAKSLEELIVIDVQQALKDRLGDLLKRGMQVHELPVSLHGNTGVTRGFLSASPVRHGDIRQCIYLAAT